MRHAVACAVITTPAPPEILKQQIAVMADLYQTVQKKKTQEGRHA
jgi:hypothetical protein